jgi:TatD DNase family protein
MIPEFVDVHSHLNFSAFDADRDATVKRALDSGVWMMNVGTQFDTSKKAVLMAEKYKEGVYAIVGLHPIHTDKSYHDEKELGEGGVEFTSRGEIFNPKSYLELAKHPKTVAIGECGLDFYRIKNDELGIMNEGEIRKKQEKAFEMQIELANEVGKPLMLHVRNGSGLSAYREALAMIKRLAKVQSNFHFFAGDWSEAKEILDAGCNLSFTGVITFARNYDEIIKNTPIDRIMSETDCPYVSPAPFRGKRNESAYVKEVVKMIAEIRGEDFEIVRRQLVANAERFFGLKFRQ